MLLVPVLDDVVPPSLVPDNHHFLSASPAKGCIMQSSSEQICISWVLSLFSPQWGFAQISRLECHPGGILTRCPPAPLSLKEQWLNVKVPPDLQTTHPVMDSRNFVANPHFGNLYLCTSSNKNNPMMHCTSSSFMGDQLPRPLLLRPLV